MYMEVLYKEFNDIETLLSALDALLVTEFKELLCQNMPKFWNSSEDLDCAVHFMQSISVSEPDVTAQRALEAFPSWVFVADSSF
ncbi:unnamed protein product [Nippostrongylus brasiliensis]|uniref:Ovule protein n=1 Tax=Nippostrongylus brasiliensis TaxID=27835 RepID=A0A0N4XP05_NIPBR|nr:unnamed protein product [Nippostrongylus brasiliensis]